MSTNAGLRGKSTVTRQMRRILDYLLQVDRSVHVGEVVEALDLSHRSGLWRSMHRLQDQELVQAEGAGRGTTYSICEERRVQIEGLVRELHGRDLVDTGEAERIQIELAAGYVIRKASARAVERARDALQIIDLGYPDDPQLRDRDAQIRVHLATINRILEATSLPPEPDHLPAHVLILHVLACLVPSLVESDHGDAPLLRRVPGTIWDEANDHRLAVKMSPLGLATLLWSAMDPADATVVSTEPSITVSAEAEENGLLVSVVYRGIVPDPVQLDKLRRGMTGFRAGSSILNGWTDELCTIKEEEKETILELRLPLQVKEENNERKQ